MKKAKSAAGLLSLAGAGVLLAGTVLAPPIHAQSLVVPCTTSGFDVCFPNVETGAPNAACTTVEDGSAATTECLSRVCRAEAAEPTPGFFAYCCARGGAQQYDEFCVFAVQTACPDVAEHCADRCPPLRILTGTVTIAPPPAACLPSYPAFIAQVCAQDPFCCSTSWDSICADEALAARAAAGPGGLGGVILDVGLIVGAGVPPLQQVP